MAGFKLEGFKGLRPKVSPRLLEQGEATEAYNVTLDAGDIDPIKTATASSPLPLTLPKSLYYYPNDGTPTWLTWQTDVDVARSPVEEDQLARLYFTGAPDNPAAPTGSAKPKLTWKGVAHTGPQPTPPRTWRYLGVPAPTAAPVAAATSPYEYRLSAYMMSTTELKATIHYAAGEQDSGAFGARLNWMEFQATGAPTEMMWYGSQGGEKTATFGADGAAVFTPIDYEILEIIDSNRVRVKVVPPQTNIISLDSNDNKWNVPSSLYTFTRGVSSGVAPKSANVRFSYDGPMILTLWGTTTYLRVGFKLRIAKAQLFGYHYAQRLLTDGMKIYDKTPSEWTAPTKSSYKPGGTGTAVENFVHHEKTVLANAAGTATFDFDVSMSFDVIPGDAAADDLESRAYVYTYVSTFNEEGPPSDPSPVLEVVSGYPAAITGMVAPPSPYNSYIDRYRLYRTSTGLTTAEFLFAGEFAVSATHTDYLPTVQLGDPLPSTDFDPPPAELRGIVALPTGALAGFVGNRVLYSEPYQVHAWPYTKYVDAEIVGIAAFADSLLAVTDRTPYILSGAHPRTVAVRKLSLEQPCVAKRGIAVVGDTVVYPSPDGLVAVNTSGASIITSDFMTKREWQAIDVTTLRAAVLDNTYYGFHSAGIIIFDPASGLLTTSDVVGESPTYEPLQDELFYTDHDVSSGVHVYKWGAGGTRMSALWSSGILRMETPVNLSCGRVVADAYPLTLSLYRGPTAVTLVTTITVSSGNAFRLPAGYLDTDFKINLQTDKVVRMVQLAETMEELADG